MAVSIHIDLGYEFHTTASIETVWALLSDLPQAALNFPHLEQLVHEGNHVYRWELRPIGNAHVGLQTVYASQYRFSPPTQTAEGTTAAIEWDSVAGVGNAEIDGNWQIKSLDPAMSLDPVKPKTRDSGDGAGTQLTLHIQGQLHLSVPSLMKSVVAPLVTKEFEMLVKQYIDNLLLHWSPPA